MKIHYNNAMRHERNVIPLCKTDRTNLPSTVVPQLVTCKRCIKAMGHPPAPDPIPEPAIFFMFNGEILPWENPQK